MDEQAINTSPSIGTFVLYAERSVKLGSHDSVSGSVGVAIGAGASFGAQLTLADHVAASDLYAASVIVGDHSSVHDVYANTSQLQAGVAVHSSQAYPASTMPFLPLVTAGSIGTNSVSVTTPTQLVPGTYGSLENHSVLTLSAGTYTFSNITLDSHSVLNASGTVIIRVSGQFAVLDHAVASSNSAQNLRFDVSGADLVSAPACAIGSHAVVHGLISAPHGTLAFSDHVSATGAFAAFDITVDVNTAFSLDDGFVPTADDHGSQQLSGYLGRPVDGSYPVIGPVLGSTLISISIGLPVRDPVGLQAFIDQASQPTSAGYRHYLTIDQFRTTYGATDADYQALQSWAISTGLAIEHTFSNNLLLAVSGTAASLESALHANLVYRQSSDHITQFVTVDREPSVSATPQILWITGLDESEPVTSAGCVHEPPSALHAPGEVTGTDGGFMAGDLRAAYLGLSTTCSFLDGSGQTVGILSTQLYRQSDIDAYAAGQTTGIDSSSVTEFLVTSNWFTSDRIGFGDGEIELDIDMVLAMAPKAKVHVFEGVDAVGGDLDDLLHAMASDSTITVATSSFGFKSTSNSAQALSEMAARGVTFFNASGDYGDIGNPGNNSDMANQTLVGGTILIATTVKTPAPFQYCPDVVGAFPFPDCYYGSEATWNQGCPGVVLEEDPDHLTSEVLGMKGITGGGIMDDSFGLLCECFNTPRCCATAVQIPTLYQDPGLMTSLDSGGNGGSKLYRNYPDVSANAQGVETFFGKWMTTAGTSASAPLWAGWTALANEFANNNGLPPVGFANPLFYAIGRNSDLYGKCFNDVHDGEFNSNTPGLQGFPAVVGYDLATGWGSPKCGLIEQIGTPHPTTPQSFDTLVGHLAVGADGVDASSTVTLTIRDPAGNPMGTTVLKQPTLGWLKGSVQEFTLPLSLDFDPPLAPLTPFDIGGLVISISGSDDDVDVTGLEFELASGVSAVTACLVDLSGEQGDVTRLSSADNGGPTDAVLDLAFSGCSRWKGPSDASVLDSLVFIIDTGSDDLNNDSTLRVDLYSTTDGSGAPLEGGVLHADGAIRYGDQTQWSVPYVLQQQRTAQDIGSFRFTMTSNSGDDEWDLEGMKIFGLSSQADGEYTCLKALPESAPSGCGTFPFGDLPCPALKFESDGGAVEAVIKRDTFCQ